jgi:hypothetical protein
MRIIAFLLAGLAFSSTLSANTNNSSNINTSSSTQKLAAQKAFIQTINQCTSPKRLSNMMIKALGSVDNYSVKANNAGFFEEIMLNNPSCVVVALNQMPVKKCEQFEEHFIRETFFVPRDQIKESLSRVANLNKSCVTL